MVFKYVYELYDYNFELFYVGSTYNPRVRMDGHIVSYGNTTKMKIISKELDIEVNLIKEYVSKGFILKNKETARNYDAHWSVGDWVVSNKLKSSDYEYNQRQKEIN